MSLLLQVLVWILIELFVWVVFFLLWVLVLPVVLIVSAPIIILIGFFLKKPVKSLFQRLIEWWIDIVPSMPQRKSSKPWKQL